MDIKTIERTIFDLENLLLKPDIRGSADKISVILDDEFIEFTSGGNIYHYKKGDTFPAANINWEIIDFSIKPLSDNTVLAIFKVIKHSEINDEKKYSIRSSIWKYANEKWKIIFHQGTLAEKLKSKNTNGSPIIKTGAAGAIIKNNKILLVKHKQKKLWQIPGGLQEPGESLEKTITRELKEELNIELKVDRLVSLFSSNKWNIKHPDGHGIQQVTAFFLMKGEFEEDRIIIQKEELDGYSFFELNSVPEDIFECCKRKVEMLRNWNGTVYLE